MGPGWPPRQATSQEPSSRHSMRHAAPAALNEAGAQLEAVVSVDPSPSWGPGQKEGVSLPTVGPRSPVEQPKPRKASRGKPLPRSKRRAQKGPQVVLPVSPVCYPSFTPSPPFPTVKMVCQMLLGDTKVLKWLLIAGFKGTFPGPAMEQRA